MRKVLTLLSGFALLSCFFSCTAPSGTDVTRTFEVTSGYYRLEISDGMIVTVSDAVDQIVITADENIMEKIIVKNTSGTLRIYRTDFSIAYINTAKVTLPFEPRLKQVKATYDSEFYTNFGIEGDKVVVKVDERSKFSGYVLANQLEMEVLNRSEVSSTFDVHESMSLKVTEASHAGLDGYATTAHVEMSNNAVFERWWNGNYYTFSCYECYGNMDGDCKAYIDCEDNLEMRLTNGSRLYYTGDPYIGDSWVDETSEIIHDGY